MKGAGKISLGLNHLQKNTMLITPMTRGPSWQKRHGHEGGKDPREVTPPDNPLLGALPRKGEQERQTELEEATG